MSTPPPMNLCRILTESNRIVKAQTRHFLALSVLSLLPPSLLAVLFPTLLQLLLESIKNGVFVKTHLRTSYYLIPDPPFDPGSLVPSISFSIFDFVFSLCAVGSITHSVFHGFFCRPVEFISALKSIIHSFLALLVTTLLCQIIISGVTGVLDLLLFLVVQVLGFHQLDYASPFFVLISLVFEIVSIFVSVYLQVNWALVSSTVVVESCWGIKPLERSAHLVKGYRWVAFSLFLLFAFLPGVLLWSSSLAAIYLGASGGWKVWVVVLQIVLTSALLTLLSLYQYATNTVLYIFCKAAHGELAMETAEESARDYVSLPFDNGEVPHLISVDNS